MQTLKGDVDSAGGAYAQLDWPLLLAERRAKPHDSRVAFYLAQTLHTIGRLDEAVAAYQERVDLGGWYEEVFEALLRKVRQHIAT